MSNYEIKIKVAIQKTQKELTKHISKTSDGSLRIVISEESGKSIDTCEKALLATNYPAIREALACQSEYPRQRRRFGEWGSLEGSGPVNRLCLMLKST